jgi:hypothetical protein
MAGFGSPLVAALLVAVAPATQGMRATATSGWEHGYLLHYGSQSDDIAVTDFFSGSLELTARDAGEVDDEARVRADFAIDGHVWRVELADPLTPASPRVASIELSEGRPVRTANPVPARKTVRDPAADESFVTGEQKVFGFAGTRAMPLPPAGAQLVIRSQARVWRDGRLVGGGLPAEVVILEHGIVQPERGGALVRPPSPQSGREVHLIVEELPIRSLEEGRLHAVFDRPNVGFTEAEPTP